MSNKTIITTVIRMMAGGCGLPLNKSFSKYVLCFLNCLAHDAFRSYDLHQEGHSKEASCKEASCRRGFKTKIPLHALKTSYFMSVLLAKNLKYSVFCLLLVLCRIAAYIRLLNAVER